MSYELYLGDIDPNNFIGNPIEIRRSILFNLLLWDHIVMSDSQIITDPRICCLMNQEVRGTTKNDFELTPWSKDFEALLSSGLIQIACRKKDNKQLTLSEVWSDMSNNNGQRIPYLPHSIRYASYLDKKVLNPLTYDLNVMSFRFKKILLDGIDSSEVNIGIDDTGKELKKMIEECSIVLFRDLLEFLKNQKCKGLSEERYFQLYDYIKDCYHANLPIELGCFTSCNLEDIPMHLSTSEDLAIEDNPNIDFEKMKPTWTFNHLVIDYLPTNAMIEIKQQLAKHSDVVKLIQDINMGKAPSNPSVLYDAWEYYTTILEQAMKNSLCFTKDNLEALIKQKTKYVNARYIGEGLKLIVGCLPIIGNVVTGLDAATLVKDCFSWNVLQKRETGNSVETYKTQIKTFLDILNARQTHIITKYNKY